MNIYQPEKSVLPVFVLIVAFSIIVVMLLAQMSCKDNIPLTDKVNITIDVNNETMKSVYGRPFYDYRIKTIDSNYKVIPDDMKDYYVRLLLASEYDNTLEMFDAWKPAFNELVQQRFSQYYISVYYSYGSSILQREASIFIGNTTIEQVAKERGKWVQLINDVNQAFRSNTEVVADINDAAKQVFGSEDW